MLRGMPLEAAGIYVIGNSLHRSVILDRQRTLSAVRAALKSGDVAASHDSRRFLRCAVRHSVKRAWVQCQRAWRAALWLSVCLAGMQGGARYSRCCTHVPLQRAETGMQGGAWYLRC